MHYNTPYSMLRYGMATVSSEKFIYYNSCRPNGIIVIAIVILLIIIMIVVVAVVVVIITISITIG